MMFEQELYHNFFISNSRPYFITFAGDVSVCFLLTSSRLECLQQMISLPVFRVYSHQEFYQHKIRLCGSFIFPNISCQACLYPPTVCYDLMLHSFSVLQRKLLESHFTLSLSFRHVRLAWTSPAKKKPNDSEPPLMTCSTDDSGK